MDLNSLTDAAKDKTDDVVDNVADKTGMGDKLSGMTDKVKDMKDGAIDDVAAKIPGMGGGSDGASDDSQQGKTCACTEEGCSC